MNMFNLLWRRAPEKLPNRSVIMFGRLARISMLLMALAVPSKASAAGWEYWGGDQGGTRFSNLDQITPANVENLVLAWGVPHRRSRQPAEGCNGAHEVRGNAAVCRELAHPPRPSTR
jgi:hypothetical protein